MENRIYVSIPLDALIVSGITSDCAVEISAMDGAILIERCWTIVNKVDRKNRKIK